MLSPIGVDMGKTIMSNIYLFIDYNKERKFIDYNSLFIDYNWLQ
jgi:hypothetical protein